MTKVTESPAPVLLRSDTDGIATLTLNRPEARNALSVRLLSALQREFDAIAEDKSVRCVVIAANGPVFCAGHDLKEIRANPGRPAYESLFAQCAKVMMSIIRLPQPVVAKVQGTATAAGCQLVATCDLAISVEGALFATPGVNIGLFCSTPMVALSRNVGRKASMDMLLTGRPITAAKAEHLGLINDVVADGELNAAVDEITALLAAKSPLTLAIGKEAFYQQLDMPLADAYAYAAEAMTRNMLARDAEEGIDAFIEKRPPVWKGQ